MDADYWKSKYIESEEEKSKLINLLKQYQVVLFGFYSFKKKTSVLYGVPILETIQTESLLVPRIVFHAIEYLHRTCV